MPAGTTDPLTTLQHVLASAAQIAHDLAGDALLPRLLDAFARTPAEDREGIVNVLEREIDLVNLSRGAPSGTLSGVQLTKLNPNARLYMRITDSDPVPYIAPEELVQAVIRAARLMNRAIGRRPDQVETWEAAMVHGLGLVEPEERDTLRWYHRRILELLDAAEPKPD
jgi:hypothetical protein